MRLRPSLLLVVPATLAACDAALRFGLWWAARNRRLQNASRSSHPSHPSRPPKTLIVIPARAEGDRLQATLASTAGTPADVLLLLDGDDPGVNAQGSRVVVKTPAGPSKAAALAWLAREHRALLESYESILVLDAGSRLAPDFFERFVWPEDAAAVQTVLRGSSDGVGAAAAESERVAQDSEDRGREAVGWNVRLRGTGSAFRSRTFVELMPRVDTRIEDLEASLLLTAQGDVIRLVDAVVLDEKPEGITSAASQRARWLLGRPELLFRRAPAFASVVAKRPLEGFAFVAEIFGRPITLTAPLRLLAAWLLLRQGRILFSSSLAVTVAADVALHANASPASVVRMGGSWLMALLLAPRALVRWMRA